MGQEESRLAVNRDLHRAVAELRNPPSKGKLPRRSKGALNDGFRTQQTVNSGHDPVSRKQKAPRPDKYEVQASPEPTERRKKPKRARTRQSLNRVRYPVDDEALCALQLEQFPESMEDGEEEEEEQPPHKALKTRARTTEHNEVDEDIAPGDANPIDDAALDAEILAGEHLADSVKPEAEPSVAEQQEEQQPTPKKRGRPPKAQKAGRGKKQPEEPVSNPNASRPPEASKSTRASARQKQSSIRAQARMDQIAPASRSELEPAAAAGAEDVDEEDVAEAGPSRQPQRRTNPRQAAARAKSNVAVVVDPGDLFYPSNGNDDQPTSYDETYGNEEAEHDEQEQNEEEPEEEHEEEEHAAVSSNRARISRRLTAIRDSSREPSTEEEPQGNFRLFGEWPSLRQIVRAAERHESAMDTWEFDDSAVGNAFQTCREITDRLINSKQDLERVVRDSVEDTVGELWNEMRTLNSAVEQLCNPPKPLSKSKGYERTNSVYGMLFPALVHLLDAVVAFYEYLDVELRSKPRLDLEHLGRIVTLAKSIGEHGRSGRLNLHPDPSFPIKQSIHKHIILALDTLATALSEQHEEIQADRDFRLEQQRENRRYAAQGAREKIIRAREKHLKRLVNKWEVLHMVRERMYPDFRLLADRATRAHLAYPRNSTDVDADGIPYIAERVFAPRVGPSPSAVQNAEAQAGWPKEHVHALVWGLQEFAGPSVIEDVIKAYCGIGGPLSPYNVTEIVVKAAYWRERLIKKRWEEGRVVEDWIKQIPVWTKRHEMGGEENREPLEGSRSGGVADE